MLGLGGASRKTDKRKSIINQIKGDNILKNTIKKKIPNLANTTNNNSYNNNNNNLKYRKSNLRTEVVLRKEKLDPKRLNVIKDIANYLSKNDIEYLKYIFDQKDTDKSGVLARSELYDALLLIGIQTNDKELDEFLSFADADGSKAIDYDEWLMLVSLFVQPPYKKEELENSFNLLFTTNDHGFIYMKDFHNIMSEILQSSLSSNENKYLKSYLDSFVEEFDSNRDGLLDPDECIDQLLKNNTINNKE